MSRWDRIFPLGDPPDYEPAPETSVAAVAEREGRRPEEVVLDWMLERDGTAFLFAPLASYEETNLEAVREMMLHPNAVLGLSDGGAHCGLICDVSMPTTLLTHWLRDRTRGELVPIEQLVRLQTGRTAEVYGFDDRGTLEVGKRADINLVDLDALTLHAPEMIFDLPAEGRRLIQRVDGYRATFVAGVQTYADGEHTGATPGPPRPLRPAARLKLVHRCLAPMHEVASAGALAVVDLDDGARHDFRGRASTGRAASSRAGPGRRAACAGSTCVKSPSRPIIPSIISEANAPGAMPLTLMW